MCSVASLVNVASGELLWFSKLSDYTLLSGMKGASSSSPSSIWVGVGAQFTEELKDTVLSIP